jgi:hypothetical protein
MGYGSWVMGQGLTYHLLPILSLSTSCLRMSAVNQEVSARGRVDAHMRES